MATALSREILMTLDHPLIINESSEGPSFRASWQVFMRLETPGQLLRRMGVQ